VELVSHVLKTRDKTVFRAWPFALAGATAGARGMKELIEIKELARRLSVPVTFIYDRTRKNSPDPIPHLKIGKYVRFDPEAVVQWLELHRR
jgi:excisionase family DNA binding protein